MADNVELACEQTAQTLSAINETLLAHTGENPVDDVFLHEATTQLNDIYQQLDDTLESVKN